MVIYCGKTFKLRRAQTRLEYPEIEQKFALDLLSTQKKNPGPTR